MKKLTRLIAIVCSIFMLGSLVACGNGGKEGDQTKTVLYVSDINACLKLSVPIHFKVILQFLSNASLLS